MAQRAMTTSEQARADAMADAETLRQWIGYDMPPPNRAVKIGQPGVIAQLVGRGFVETAARLATDAARAAFRAVPALRGEK